MTKSLDLWGIADVSAYFGVSESTIRRKVKKRRENGFGFVIPIFSQGSKLLWRRVDVENFQCEDAETITFNSSPAPAIPSAQMQSHAQAQQTLRALGVKLPSQPNNQSNN